MIGVNLWGLIPAMNADASGILRHLREIGFEAVEGMVVPKKRDAKARGAISSESSFSIFAEEAKKQGLSIPSVHVFNVLEGRFLPITSVIRTLRHLCREYGIESFVFSGAFTDAKGARKWAAYLNELAQALESEACRIVYHNHDQEFRLVTVNGRTMTAMDYFFSMLREDVLLQLDIGWAGVGGDEVALAIRYADRIHSLHLKDFIPGTRGNYHNPNVPVERFSAIGAGEIRTAEVLALRDTFPNFSGHIIMDQDFSAGDLLQDLRTGYWNLMEILLPSGSNSREERK